jgi:small subunit ribosomal protein S11
MGKKRVVKKTEKEVLKEKEQIEEALKKIVKIKAKGKIDTAKIYISSSYNNTIITLTDDEGKILLSSSAGKLGFKGTKKGTPFAASKVADFVGEAAKKAGIKNFEVLVKGIGAGRDSALKSLAAKGLDIIILRDITPLPHNGPRPRKPRRM